MTLRSWIPSGQATLVMVASAAMLAGCGAQSGESAAVFQRLAADYAPLAQAKAAQAGLGRLPVLAAAAASAAALPATEASEAALPSAVVVATAALVPGPSELALAAAGEKAVSALAASQGAGPSAPSTMLPAAGLANGGKALQAPPVEALVPAEKATASGQAGLASAPAHDAPKPELAPMLATLVGLAAPTAPRKVLFGQGTEEGVSWKALGRGAEAMLDANGYSAKRSGALSTGESLNLQGWQNPTLELQLAAGAGQLRLVWASEGPLPEEHALGAKLVPGADGLKAKVELGAFANRPGRLILVAKGEGQAPLRVLGVALVGQKPSTTASIGMLASR